MYAASLNVLSHHYRMGVGVIPREGEIPMLTSGNGNHYVQMCVLDENKEE